MDIRLKEFVEADNVGKMALLGKRVAGLDKMVAENTVMVVIMADVLSLQMVEATRILASGPF